MMVEEATITSKGQITIPKKIRDRLGLTPGTKVAFLVRGKEVVLLPKPKDPLKELENLRKEISFTEEEITSFMQEAKQKWSKVQIS